MSFWSDTTLRKNLKYVIHPANPDKVDISGYRLSVGNQVFISNDSSPDENGSSAIDLTSSNGFEIPAGQFALITTLEKVTIPADSFGLISMRAGKKFKGLINVSGFHVDPGYSDTLVFSVFNAGPKSIYISKNEDIFLIWFAGLDQENENLKGGGGLDGNIPSEFINSLNIQAESTPVLSNKIKKLENNLQSTLKWGIPIASTLGALALFIITWAGSSISDLKGKSLYFDTSITKNENMVSASVIDLKKDDDELRRLIIQTSTNIQISDYDKRLHEQATTIVSLQKRLDSLEKNVTTPGTKKN